MKYTEGEVNISAQISRAQKDALRQAAARQGIPVSQMLRKVLTAWMRSEADRAGGKPDD